MITQKQINKVVTLQPEVYTLHPYTRDAGRTSLPGVRAPLTRSFGDSWCEPVTAGDSLVGARRGWQQFEFGR